MTQPTPSETSTQTGPADSTSGAATAASAPSATSSLDSAAELSDAADASPSASPSAHQIAEYLRLHPDFFRDFPAILEEMTLPHDSGSAVSLVERQLAVLRDRNVDMRDRLGTLLANARLNDRLFQRTRELILDALDAEGLVELIGVVRRHLLEEFSVDQVTIILFVPPPAEPPSDGMRFDAEQTAQLAIGNLMRNNQTVLGVLRGSETQYLFPDCETPPRSAAVVPMSHDGLLGVLAIGSADPRRFTSDMGTLFIRHVGEVLSRLIARSVRAV